MGSQRAGGFDTVFGLGTALVMAAAGLALVFVTFVH
jgi:hypothetical protein